MVQRVVVAFVQSLPAPTPMRRKKNEERALPICFFQQGVGVGSGCTQAIMIKISEGGGEVKKNFFGAFFFTHSLCKIFSFGFTLQEFFSGIWEFFKKSYKHSPPKKILMDRR